MKKQLLLGALALCHPQEPGLSKGAAVTSGKFASLRGLPGVSPMAERIGLERDLALVEMTGVRYHADQITVAASRGGVTAGYLQHVDVRDDAVFVSSQLPGDHARIDLTTPPPPQDETLQQAEQLQQQRQTQQLQWQQMEQQAQGQMMQR